MEKTVHVSSGGRAGRTSSAAKCAPSPVVVKLPPMALRIFSQVRRPIFVLSLRASDCDTAFDTHRESFPSFSSERTTTGYAGSAYFLMLEIRLSSTRLR